MVVVVDVEKCGSRDAIKIRKNGLMQEKIVVSCVFRQNFQKLRLKRFWNLF